MTLFQKMTESSEEQLRLFTVLEGAYEGHKALFAGEALQWESVSQGFFSEHQDEVGKREETGVFMAAGNRVFCDSLSREKKLVICGGGHVSMPIIRLGNMLGFAVTVLEDRPSFADNARGAGADQVICDSFVHALNGIKGGKNTYFVVVTRGHRFDQECLQEILRKPFAYVGMMGSRSRAAIVRQNLIEAGFPEDLVREIHTPIGLSIQAETPEEIAVSVMGEIIAVKNQRKESFGYPKELLEILLNRGKEEVVLATIIARRGSAPRGVGTKMVVASDGTLTGTIGGGCMEAEVRSIALSMLRKRESSVKICNVNMVAKEAEEEGMVCGGSIDVLLERVSDQM